MCALMRVPCGDRSWSQSCRVSAIDCAVTSHIATLQPSATSCRTSSRPMPEPPPVTTASLPAKSFMCLSGPFVYATNAVRYSKHAPSLSQAIDARSGAVEQCRALIGRVAFAEALERVPQHRIAAAQLVYGKVRLEHAALGAEALDRVLEVTARRLHQLGAGRGRGTVLPAVAVDLHVEPAKLGHHIRA